MTATPDTLRTALILLAVFALLATVWGWHVRTRDWNENVEQRRGKGWRVSNHRKYQIEYNRRTIADAVAGMRRADVHYAYGYDDGPICGQPLSTRAVLYPTVRWVTCPDCHAVLQNVLRATFTVVREQTPTEELQAIITATERAEP